MRKARPLNAVMEAELRIDVTTGPRHLPKLWHTGTTGQASVSHLAESTIFFYCTLTADTVILARSLVCLPEPRHLRIFETQI